MRGLQSVYVRMGKVELLDMTPFKADLKSANTKRDTTWVRVIRLEYLRN